MTQPTECVSTLFLDAGNTLLEMDYALLASQLADAGLELDAQAIGRAEVRARRVLSDWLEARAFSTEGGETRRAYIGAVLKIATGSDYPMVAEALAEWLSTPEAADALFSRVETSTRTTLVELKERGIKLWVVSNSDGQVEERLEGAGLLELLDGVTDSGKVGFEKPHPGIFEAALAASGSDREATVHVGDIYSVDILGARRANLRGVLIDPSSDALPAHWEAIRIQQLSDLASQLDLRPA